MLECLLKRTAPFLTLLIFISTPTICAETDLSQIEKQIIEEKASLSERVHSGDLYLEARDYYNRQMYDESLNSLNQILSIDPTHENALELKQLCEIRNNLHDKSSDKRSVKKQVNRLVKEAEHLYLMRKYDESIQLYEELTALNPKKTEKYHGLSMRSKEAKIANEESKIYDTSALRNLKLLRDVNKAYYQPTITDGPKESKVMGSRLTQDELRRRELERKANEVIPVVDFKEAQIRDVLKYLSKISGVNIVIDDAAASFDDTVTMYLKDATLIEILDTIIRAKGLIYELQKNMIWVTTKEQLEREDVVVEVYDVQDLVGRLYNFPARGLISDTGEDDDDEDIEEDDDE